MSQGLKALSAGVVDLPASGPMLVIGHSPLVDKPCSDSVRLIVRRVGKRLGVGDSNFVQLPEDHESFRTHRLPLVGLPLDLEHLPLPAEVVKTANGVLDEIGGRVLRGLPSSDRNHEKARPTNRTSRSRAERARFH